MINFYKYHALGNDYIVIDPNDCPFDLNANQIKHICHRNFGIGSDGILYGPYFENDEITFKIFNPDGSEAEKSGNGIRIFARYLIDKGLINESKFELKTLGGKVSVEVLDEKGNLIKVAMGEPTFFSNNIPVLGENREVINEIMNFNGQSYKATCLSIGNPHCVILVPQVSADLARLLGPVVEKHSAFPNRINMQLLEIIDYNNIKIEIWERGAGYTLASGSSSCAAASVAHRLGLVGNEVTVYMPGGKIDICIEDEIVYMTGEVSSVCEGHITPQFYKKLKSLS